MYQSKNYDRRYLKGLQIMHYCLKTEKLVWSTHFERSY